MTIYIDMFAAKEMDRIDAIGKAAIGGALVGFVVEDDAKADRYIAALQQRFPTVSVVDRITGPVAGTVLVRVRGRAN
jgi:hypothetical protein